jgi:competence ComEA-like helix-hairpin-helix protein
LGTRQEIGLVVLLLILAGIGYVPDLFSIPITEGQPYGMGMESSSDTPASGSHTLLAGRLINLNTARASDLEVIPGIGPVLAQRIIAARDECGGFSDLKDLLAVHGIGKKRIETLRKYTMIGEKVSRPLERFDNRQDRVLQPSQKPQD